MEINLSNVVLGFVFSVLTAVTFVGLVLAFVHASRRKKRYSPFNEDALRLPGHSLRVKRNELFDTLTAYYVAFIATAMSAFLISILLNSLERVVVLVSLLGFTVYLLRRTWVVLEDLRRNRLGREGEEYVGQELNYLMCRNALVFHDIPYKYGNIDHIVVGHNKVFVVETKAFTKPQKSGTENKKDVNVVYDGNQLAFPHMKTKKPIEQAKRHAEHVRKVLKKNCGLDVDVVPVVALPGWFVNTQGAGKDVLVINPKRGKGLYKWLGKSDCDITKNPVALYLDSVARSISAGSDINDPNASDKYDFWLNPRKMEVGLS